MGIRCKSCDDSHSERSHSEMCQNLASGVMLQVTAKRNLGLLIGGSLCMILTSIGLSQNRAKDGDPSRISAVELFLTPGFMPENMFSLLTS